MLLELLGGDLRVKAAAWEDVMSKFVLSEIRGILYRFKYMEPKTNLSRLLALRQKMVVRGWSYVQDVYHQVQLSYLPPASLSNQFSSPSNE
jgi:hypothetical protein